MPLDVHPQLLRALTTVIDTGSFTLAAERLGYTQSALSKQIAALEDAAGTPLVRRRARGVEPTEAGTRLALRATSVLDQLDAAARELDTLGVDLGGVLTLGAFPAAAARLAPAAIARVRRSHPSIDVEFLPSSTPVQLRRLRGGRLDMGIVAVSGDLEDGEGNALIAETLPSGRLLVAVPEGHRLAGRGRVSVSDLADETWIVGRGAPGEPQFGAWPTLGDPIVGPALPDWSSRLGFVTAGLGVTTVPTLLASSAPRGLTTVEVDDPTPPARSLLLVHPGPLTDAGRALRDAIVAEASLIALSAG